MLRTLPSRVALPLVLSACSPAFLTEAFSVERRGQLLGITMLKI
jgi:hypothetical protein